MSKGFNEKNNLKSATTIPTISLANNIIFILLLTLTLFTSGALSSYSMQDSAWSYVNADGLVNNSMGWVGAHIADVLFYFLGILAIIVPISSLYSCYVFLKVKLYPCFVSVKYDSNRGVTNTNWSISRLIGLCLVFVATLGIFSELQLEWLVQLPMSSGGLIGTLLQQSLLYWFGNIGKYIILALFVTIGVTLWLKFSWINLGYNTKLLIINYYNYLFNNILKLANKSNTNKSNTNKSNNNTVILQDNAPNLERLSQALKNSEQQFTDSSNSLSQQSQDTSNVLPVNEALIVEEDSLTPSHFKLPSTELLASVERDATKPKFESVDLQQLATLVEQVLEDFNIKVSVVGVFPGPVITRFELTLAAGIKASKISGLAVDIARALSVARVRVVEIIPGKPVVGLEIPNENREIVFMRELVSTNLYQQAESKLTIILGKDIGGEPIIADLSKMPHLLVAGTTGSGKSVGVNVMLLSMLYKATPEDLRLILIDPKMLELSVYDAIPHLLAPVVTDMRDAKGALVWCINEMERRYRLMSALGVRNITGYNKKIASDAKIIDPLAEPGPNSVKYLTKLPFIVVIIDEFADMIMVVGKKVEELIARLAQKARAAGIHMILATQRPSVDVITGLIKANIPTRIAFQVSSKIDSRTILDQMGAENLLGQGDMLYLPPGTGMPERVHGAFVADDEVHRVVAQLKAAGEPDYLVAMDSFSEAEQEELDAGGDTNGMLDNAKRLDAGTDATSDELYNLAVSVVVDTKKASISYVQRRLKIGYNRAARLIETMEAQGVVSPVNRQGNRVVLVEAIHAENN